MNRLGGCGRIRLSLDGDKGRWVEDMEKKFYVYETGISLASWEAVRFQEGLCSIVCLS